MISFSWKKRLFPISIAAVVGIVYLSLCTFKDDVVVEKKSADDTETWRIPASQEVAKIEKATALVKDNFARTSSVVSTTEEARAITVPSPEILKSFKDLQVKIFRNQEDEKKWKKLISDSKYILELSVYLKNLPKLDPKEFKDNQNAVLDLLVEALRGGDTVAAEQAILDVIKDAQIEDANVAQNSREFLAGVKAELLYQSSSVKPQLAGQFESLLPGPVSQKIWKNVQQQQADNLAISEAELQERVARRSQ